MTDPQARHRSRRAVVVGVVGKPFGVSGACYVRPDPDVEHDFAVGTRYATESGDLVVAHRHEHGARLLLTFAGVTSREQAEELRGTVLRVDAAEVRLDPESLWADDVVGLPVVDTEGAELGTVDRLEDGPAHDYLVVARPAGSPVWVPAVAEMVRVELPGPAHGTAQGRDSGRVVVDAPPGLFDDDAISDE